MRSVRPPLTADFFRRPRQTVVGMFQSLCWDREPFIESTAIHHDSFVTRRHGVELWQKVKRVSSLVELEPPAVRPRPLTTLKMWIEGGGVCCAQAIDNLQSACINGTHVHG